MLTELLLQLGIFIVALAALLKSSDWFIDSAEEIGLSLGISPFIIGVTIVAFGTSLPELAASIASVISGDEGIIIGNVVGSNITNIALVLGAVAVVAKEVKLETDIMNIDMPYLIGSAMLLWFVCRDFVVSIPEAFILLGGIIVFLIYSFKVDEDELSEKQDKASAKSYLFLILGGIGVSVGAKFTIDAIQEISRIANINSEIIALSLVALGTSLPELIVSLTAAKKGKTSMAVGNVLGSNIFNTYVVMSIPRFVGPIIIPATILDFSLPFMIGLTLLFCVMCISNRITRWEGLMLLAFYGFFLLDLCKDLI